MSLSLISVLITTYNYGQFIEEAIDSVLSQDFPQNQVEIVIVDDGSTDDTAERVKRYGSRIEYLYKSNGGQASALNFGISKTRGEILALLDADDLFLPGKLTRVAEAFERNPGLGMLYHPLQEWHMRSGERRPWSDFFPVSGDVPEDPEKFTHYLPQPASCISFRRSALDELLPIPEEIRMLGDCYLVALIPFQTPILAIPESLTVYRIHGRNHYSTEQEHVPAEISASRLRMWEILIAAMRKWLTDNGYTRKQPAVRYFPDRWTHNQQRRRFQIEAPGRLRSFWSVVFENYVNGPMQSWRLTVFNYVSALAALIFGYTREKQMYEWRGRTMETVERVYRGLFGGRGKAGLGPRQETDNHVRPDVKV